MVFTFLLLQKLLRIAIVRYLCATRHCCLDASAKVKTYSVSALGFWVGLSQRWVCFVPGPWGLAKEPLPAPGWPGCAGWDGLGGLGGLA